MKGKKRVVWVGGATAFSLLGDQTLYAVLPTYYLELGLLPWHVGVLLSANRLVRVFINHWSERISRIYSPRRLFMASLLGGALLTAAYALLTSFVFLLVARVLWGICWTFIRQIGLTTVSESTEEGHVGRAMGLYSGLSRLGSVAGNFLGALGHDLLGFSGVLWLLSGVSLLSVPLGGLARNKEDEERTKQPEQDTPNPTPFRILLGGFAVGFVGQGAILSTLGLVLRESLGDGVEWAGVAIGVATLTGALMSMRWIADLFAPFLGGLTDRWGRRVGGLIFLLFGTLSLTVAAVEGMLPLRIGCVLVFFICATGSNVALVAEAGARGSRAVASYVTAVDLGACLGPIVGWMMPQWALPTGWIFLSGALCYGLAAWGQTRTGNANTRR